MHIVKLAPLPSLNVRAHTKEPRIKIRGSLKHLKYSFV